MFRYSLMCIINIFAFIGVAYATQAAAISKKMWQLIAIEQRRDERDAFLSDALVDKDPVVAEKAAYVLAGMPYAVTLEVLEKAFARASESPTSERDDEKARVLDPAASFGAGLNKVRAALSQAVSLRNTDAENQGAARQLLVKYLSVEKDPQVRANMLENFGRLAAPADIDFFLTELLDAQSPVSVCMGAANGLSLFFRTERTLKKPQNPTTLTAAQTARLLEWLLRQGNNVEKAQGRSDHTSKAGCIEFAAQALSSGRPNLSKDQLESLAQFAASFPDSEGVRRLLPVFARASSLDSEIITLLRYFVLSSKNVELRIDAMAPLVKHEKLESIYETLASVVRREIVAEQIALLKALESNVEIVRGSEKVTDFVFQLAQSSSRSVKVAAFSYLVASEVTNLERKEKLANLIKAALISSDPYLKVDTLAVLERFGFAGDIELVASMLNDRHVAVRGAALSALANFSEERLGHSMRFASAVRSFLNARDERSVCAASLYLGNHNMSSFDVDLKKIVSTSQFHFARQCALEALAKFGIERYRAEAELLLSYPVLPVAAQALALLRAAGIEPSTSAMAKYNGFVKKLPSIAAIESALESTVLFETTQGQIVAEFDRGAPLFVENFVSLARAGYYNRNRIFRVEPGFVVQFGDPSGDGNSALGFLVRDELSSSKHKRGTLGVATFGHDGGDAQIFFNAANNFGLNGSYTVFAHVVSGIDVLEKLSPDDYVTAVSVLDPDKRFTYRP